MGKQAHETELLPLDAQAPVEYETATFAMGCFWCPDGRFGILSGVIRTRVGYAGGTTESPTYRNIGDHAEAIQIDFDPSRITYDELLQHFFASRAHSAASHMQTGQYRSLILVHTDEQRQKAEEAVRAQAAAGGTTLIDGLVQPLEGFTQAEDYHQKFYLQGADALFEAVLEQFARFSEFVDSTVVARVNGYVAGWGTATQLEQEIESFGLPETANRILRDVVR